MMRVDFFTLFLGRALGLGSTLFTIRGAAAARLDRVVEGVTLGIAVAGRSANRGHALQVKSSLLNFVLVCFFSFVFLWPFLSSKSERIRNGVQVFLQP
jgi:hypothetical protein